MSDPLRNPALRARLDRAAAEISGQASSRARQPHIVAGMMSGGRPYHFHFTAADLLHVLRNNGIEVTLKDGSR